jgi:hypothetical protein
MAFPNPFMSKPDVPAALSFRHSRSTIFETTFEIKRETPRY